ncbi:Mov34/MPN/PAD-1 family protein [Pseudomonas aeruginosa]|uniref:Mov34/MPN/PAD-1 family protein n=1 Tax=Pseudomonas aeruginosa TaxID=287 RepID=UPI00227AAC10|nr:Mov34/MPN/PAD-1 family protein [Pseudomonas aeruginosa]WAJ75920.1 Mov34/MPN/PAD-1 family protein [Pseudomonas aeruginosa]
MSAGTTLVLTGALHARLQQHLLPPDGLEAVAILLCKRMRTENRLKLLCKDAVLVPYGECTRVRDYLEWPGRRLLEAVVLAEPDELSLVLIHSHPGGLYDFSQSDSESDAQVIPQVFANLESADQSDVVRIPRHLDTQPALIWTLVPRALGHLIHVHLDRQSERSDAGLHC